MVQILPQATNLGSQIGQSLGAGLQRGSEIGLQRGMLQEALSGLDKLPLNASPIEKTKYLLQATAGLPDQGRVLQALAPMLLGQGRVENIFGQPQPSETIPTTQQQTTPSAASPIAQATEPAKKLGGFLPRIKTEAEIDQFAKNYAAQFNDPTRYQEGRAIAESQNQGAVASNEMIKKRALTEVPELQLRPERLPIFMQEAQKYSNLADPNEIIQKARQSYKAGIERDLDILDRGEIPGALKGGLQKAKGLVGITSAFAQGGQTREEAIKGLQGTVKRLIDKGFEGEVRTTLAQRHKLSPTEIEEVIHPLTESNLSSLKRLPEASKIPPAIQQKKLQDFLKDNIGPDTSILALRHKLWNEKGYDWQEIAEAMRQIQGGDKPKKLNERQQREMFTIEQEPPVQSLSDIFRSWDRFTQYLSGAK